MLKAYIPSTRPAPCSRVRLSSYGAAERNFHALRHSARFQRNCHLRRLPQIFLVVRHFLYLDLFYKTVVKSAYHECQYQMADQNLIVFGNHFSHKTQYCTPNFFEKTFCSNYLQTISVYDLDIYIRLATAWLLVWGENTHDQLLQPHLESNETLYINHMVSPKATRTSFLDKNNRLQTVNLQKTHILIPENRQLTVFLFNVRSFLERE